MEIVDDLSREECIDRWSKLHGKPPPKYTSMQFMQQALTFEAQVKRFGGHSAAVKRALKPAAKSTAADRNRGEDRSSPPGLATSTLSLRAGMHLVREWNGRTYQVSVLEYGFQMDGKDYTSLTAIAKKITGAKWSGPRFFGLTGKRGAKHA
jgi:hypothetical protein